MKRVSLFVFEISPKAFKSFSLSLTVKRASFVRHFKTTNAFTLTQTLSIISANTSNGSNKTTNTCHIVSIISVGDVRTDISKLNSGIIEFRILLFF